MQTFTSSTYRYDIDGLRAVAVLLVTIFHINSALIPGGFIGVDLFFVISGFVITQGILKNGLSTKNDFLEFYRRRIRRITPVMLFVTAATLLGGVFILTPPDLKSLATSAIFAAASLANVYFTYFLDTSYFAQSSNTIPLLHLWSLGVEEQFYLIWPFLLFFLTKHRQLLLPSLAIIIIASIAIGEYQMRTGGASVAYYMLPARVFQLAAGGLCCVLVQQKTLPYMPRFIATLISALGLTLIAGSAALLSGSSPFPGLNAIPVTVGGAMLLLAGLNKNPVATILASRPFRHFGNISYSLYLWHWPILAYLNYMYVDITWYTGVASFVVMWGLAIFSTRVIEARYRHSNQPFSDIFKRHFVYPSIALAALCGAIIANNGFVPLSDPINYKNEFLEAKKDSAPAFDYPFVCQRAAFSVEDATNPNCLIGNGNENILLWGDSHAAQYVGMFRILSEIDGFSFRNAANSACPPLLSAPERFAGNGYKEGCRAAAPIFKQLVHAAETIIIGADWRSYMQHSKFISDFQGMLSDLENKGKRIILLGDPPRVPMFNHECVERAVKLPFINCDTLFSESISEKEITGKLHSFVTERSKIVVFDPDQLLCTAGQCSAVIDGKNTYYDESHLSIPGSEALGRELIRSELGVKLINALKPAPSIGAL